MCEFGIQRTFVTVHVLGEQTGQQRQRNPGVWVNMLIRIQILNEFHVLNK